MKDRVSWGVVWCGVVRGGRVALANIYIISSLSCIMLNIRATVRSCLVSIVYEEKERGLWVAYRSV